MQVLTDVERACCALVTEEMDVSPFLGISYLWLSSAIYDAKSVRRLFFENHVSWRRTCPLWALKLVWMLFLIWRFRFWPLLRRWWFGFIPCLLLISFNFSSISSCLTMFFSQITYAHLLFRRFLLLSWSPFASWSRITYNFYIFNIPLSTVRICRVYFFHIWLSTPINIIKWINIFLN